MVDEQEFEVLDVRLIKAWLVGLMDEHDPTVGVLLHALIAVEARIEVARLADVDLTHGATLRLANEDVASCVLERGANGKAVVASKRAFSDPQLRAIRRTSRLTSLTST